MDLQQSLRRWTPQPVRSLPAIVALLALAYAAVNHALIPFHRLLPFPIHSDDFRNVSESLATVGAWPARPVSTVALALLSMAGAPVYYGALLLLTLLYPALVLLFLSRLFERPVPPALVVLAGATLFAFPNAVEYPMYTGLLTNLLSEVFGAAALLCLLAAARSPRAGPWSAAGLLFFASSAFAKEDYVLPPLLLAAWLVRTGTARRRAALAALVGLVAIALALAAYNHKIGGRAFTNLSHTGPYTVDFSPASVTSLFLRYLTMSKYLLAVTVLFLLAAAAALWKIPQGRPRVLLVCAFVVLLVAPYTVLPNHVYPYYAFGWLPLQIGLSGFVLLELTERSVGGRVRRVVFAAATAVALCAVGLTLRERRDVVRYYQSNQDRCRRMIQTLVENRDAIAREPRVGVLGLDGLSPWSLSHAEYLRRRLGLHNEWIVFVPQSSLFYEIDEDGKPMRTPPILVRPVSALQEYAGLSFVAFDRAGRGILSRGLPDSVQTVRQLGPSPSIVRVFPPQTRAGHRFQVQPAGASAVTVEGAGFDPLDTILWNGRPLVTAYGGSSLLTALVPDELIAAAGDVQISVRGASATFRVLPAER